jgi:hypothetical protein
MNLRPTYLTVILILALIGYTFLEMFDLSITIATAINSHIPDKTTTLIKCMLIDPIFYIRLICIALAIIMFFGKNWARISFVVLNAFYVLLLIGFQIRNYHYYASQYYMHGSYAKEFLSNSIIYDVIVLAAILLFTILLYLKQANQYFKA